MVRLLRPALEAALDEDSQNLGRALRRRALEDTADFVGSHLATARSFATARELLRHALSQVPPDGRGIVCEFGVFRGDSIRLIAEAFPGQTVYGFDSFQGLPEDWQEGFPQGTFKLEGLPEVPRNVTLVRGWYSETLVPFLDEHPEDVSFLHVDCDLYSSAKTVLQALELRLRPGTVIVFDEYFNYVGWRLGEFRAFAELVHRAGLGFEYIGYTRSQQAAVRIL
jgi:hypothetical protein